MKKIRILIADDHDVVRRGLKLLLRGSTEFAVVAEASNGDEAITLVSKHKPDVAILDISMPGMTGIEATTRIRNEHVTTKILILTIHENEEYVSQMIRAGANGYVLKDAGKEEIFTAVRSVAAGNSFFSPNISKLMIDQFVQQARIPAPESSSSKPTLTKRESEILHYIAMGFTNAKIAEKLFLSVRTVDTHRTNIMHKLDIHDAAGLVRYAIVNGLVDIKTKS